MFVFFFWFIIFQFTPPPQNAESRMEMNATGGGSKSLVLKPEYEVRRGCYLLLYPRVMGCGAEATGLGFVCFVVLNSRVFVQNLST